jgi:hypothetical protein
MDDIEPPPTPPRRHVPLPSKRLRAGLVILFVASALTFIFGREGVRIALPTGATPTSQADAFYSRPLHVPSLAPGDSCPVVPGRTINPRLGPAIGEGPVYLTGVSDGTVEFAPPADFGSQSWAGQITLYAVRPDYAGYVLLRGRQLDGQNEVRFGYGDVPRDSSLLTAAPDPQGNEGWTNAGLGYTRVRSDGCYAVQADGTTFSEIIVFRARVLTASTAPPG